MKIEKTRFWDSWIPETEWEANYLLGCKKDCTMFLHGMLGFYATIFALVCLVVIAFAKFRFGGF